MTSSRPYLVRAVREWILDNAMTPYLLVDAEHPGAAVPREYVQNGKIVLNVSPAAAPDLDLADNEWIRFRARFSGKPMQVEVPVMAVLALYARESGQGMVFGDEDQGGPADPTQGPDKPRRPTLKVVK